MSKYVKELEKCLIYTEYTEVILKDGRKQNGNLKYTIRPIQDAVDCFYRQQMRNMEQDVARTKDQKILDNYNKKHPKATA